MTESVLVERHGTTAVIRLNRPSKLNAWTSGMRDAIIDAFGELQEDSGTAAIVTTGTGRGFCAGQDLEETSGITPTDDGASSEWIDSFERLYHTVRHCSKPVVAAMNGIAAGSGFQYALVADLRIGHGGSRMGQPEILSGIPSITGIWAMWSVLGRSKTYEFALTGQLVDGDEAARLGLVNTLVEEQQVLPCALNVAERLGGMPKEAWRLTKGRLREIEDSSFADAFRRAHEVHREAYQTGEPQREMTRFLARQAPATGSRNAR